MTGVDTTVLLVYVAATFVLGLFFATKVRNSSDLFTAGRQSPWWVSGVSGYMTMFSAGTFVVWGGIAYRYGAVAITINMMYGIAAILVGFFVAGRWRQIGVTTAAEFIELRFGKASLFFYTLSNLIFRMAGVGMALYSIAIMACALIPLGEGHFLRDPQTHQLSIQWAILFIGVIVTVYTLLGGLWAVLMTDVLQFIVLTIAVAIAVPLSFIHAGGIRAFIASSPEGFFLPVAGEWTWIVLAAWCATHFFMIGAEWAFVQRFLCVPSQSDAKKSAWLFGVLYLLSPMLWMLPPMIYRTINPNLMNPDQAYIYACRSVLPAGMIGLMLAAMFSATASLIDSQMNVFSSVLTNDFYKRFARKVPSDRQLMLVGRGLVLVLGICLTLLAIGIPYLGGPEKVVFKIASMVVGPLMLPTIWGLMSRRIGQKAVLITSTFSIILILWFQQGFSMLGIEANVPQLKTMFLWMEQNRSSAEMCVGVGIPFVILTICELLSRGTSAGWLRVNEQISRQSYLTVPNAPSTLPLKVVGWSLISCGCLLLSITPWVDHDVAVLVGFSLLLVAIGLVVLGWLHFRAGVEQSVPDSNTKQVSSVSKPGNPTILTEAISTGRSLD